jgi:hemerythrin-like metal-binding protein
MYIRWDKKLETGNELIDAQHRILVMLFKKLDIAIKTGLPNKTIFRIIVEVKKFAEFHFYSEENLMYEVGFPALEKHEVIHSNLLTELNMMVARMTRQREFPDDLLSFLNDWLIEHIGQEDQKIAEYITTSERRPVAEDLYSQYLLGSKSSAA